jgi:polyvinyl alcohol dehydrogenase (cytochrome)
MKSIQGFITLLAVLAVSASTLAQQPAAPSAPAPKGPGSTFPTGDSEGLRYRLFLYSCGGCHGKLETAPPPALLKKLSPEKIYEAMTTGVMKTQAAGLTEDQKVQIAEAVSGRRLGLKVSGDARAMSNVCRENPPADLEAKPSWNGWSPDALKNTRYQSAKAANLSPAAVSRLQLKWAFGLPLATSGYVQPTVVGGQIFIGSDSGYLYSIDAATGCVHWSFLAQAGLRSTPMIAPAKPGSKQTAAFFGDIRGNVYSVDTSNGELLWKTLVDPHPLSRITAGVKVYDGRVYVSVASLEEPEAAGFNYPCCTFRGMVVALDAATGKQIWKTYTIPQQPGPQKTSKGVSFMGPSGAGVWGPVTLDPKRRAVYVSTGNAFSSPDVGRSDAVLAIDMDSGKVLWVQQVLHGDVRSSGQCRSGSPPAGFPPRSAGRRPGMTPPRVAAGSGGEPAARRGQDSDTEGVVQPPLPANYYCPEEKNNPDWDFSAGVMLIDLPNGRSLAIAGQKSGVVWAFDPDKKGELVWKSDISRGEIVFGAATDGEYGYFAMRGGALAKVRLSDGLEQWATMIDPQPSMRTHRGVSAAVSLVPGAVFVAGLDGTLRAFSSFDGRQIWQYDTTQKVTTVNGVEAAGGSIGSAGAVVVNGMVYITSGYIGFQRGEPGNLLLAFGPPSD